MKFLTHIVALLDRFLSPDLRKMEARDLFRVRFLVFSILLAILGGFTPCLLHYCRNGNESIWVYQALLNTLVSIGLLGQLRRARGYHRTAAISIMWIHGLFFFSLWAIPSLFSVVYLWSSCLIVISSLIFGMGGSILSYVALTSVSVFNLLYHFDQGTPWMVMELDDYVEQLFLQLLGSSLSMAIVTGVYEFMREVSYSHQARQRLLAARHAQTGAVGELVGHIAHEVNNPLAILQGSVLRLRRQLEHNEWTHEGRKLLTNMQRSHERIIRVQQALAVFSSGNQHEPFVSREVRTILKDVQLAMRPQAQAQEVHLEFKDRSTNSAFRCQPHQLVYVLCSLIQNALDACRDHPNPRILVEVRDDSKMLYMTVADNGRGIDEAQQERIFQPFFTTKTGGNSQGLSLSVSRGILAEHGGEIHFSSRPGATTFTCQFPRDLAPASKLRKGA